MSDVQKPSGPDNLPKDWLKVHKLEKDKRQKEDLYPKEDPSQKKSQILAGLIVFTKKILNSLFSFDREASDSPSISRMRKELLLLNRLLLSLAEEDLSYNPEFIKQFPELWHNLIDVCNHVEILERKKRHSLSKIKLFINTIGAYPPNTDHPLGYYFTHYVGSDWIPFPFMDILHKLHLQYQENSATSTLGLWIAELNDLTEEL